MGLASRQVVRNATEDPGGAGVASIPIPPPCAAGSRHRPARVTCRRRLHHVTNGGGARVWEGQFRARVRDGKATGATKAGEGHAMLECRRMCAVGERREGSDLSRESEGK